MVSYIQGVFKVGIGLVVLAVFALIGLIALVGLGRGVTDFKDPAFLSTKAEIMTLVGENVPASCASGAAFELIGKLDVAKQFRADYGDCIDRVKIRYMQEKLKVLESALDD